MTPRRSARSWPSTSEPARRNDACGAGLPDSSPHHSATGSAAPVAGQLPGQVHLVAVARLDVRDDRPHAGLELGPIKARAPRVRAPARLDGHRTRRRRGRLRAGAAPAPDRRSGTRRSAPVDLRVRPEPDEQPHRGVGLRLPPPRSDANRAGAGPVRRPARGRRPGTRPTNPGPGGPSGQGRRPRPAPRSPRRHRPRPPWMPSRPTAAGSSIGSAARIGPTSISAGYRAGSGSRSSARNPGAGFSTIGGPWLPPSRLGAPLFGAT